MKTENRCTHCEQVFTPNPRVKHQEYCGRQICQKARKAKWQRQKMALDSDYRLNQKDAQDQWQERNTDYWDKYRQSHPEYCERNRQLQKLRDGKRRAQRLAKMDALTQRITIIPISYKSYDPSCKKGLDRQGQRFGIKPEKKEVHYDHQNSP